MKTMRKAPRGKGKAPWRDGSCRTPLEEERREEERGFIFRRVFPFSYVFILFFLAVKCKMKGEFFFLLVYIYLVGIEELM